MLNRNLPSKAPPAADWESILAQSVRSPAELCRRLGIPAALGDEAETATRDWPMLVPQPYLSRIRPGDPDDPLLRQVLPQAAELAEAAGYTADPLGEAASCPSGLLQKYRGRTLIVTGPACGVHCRFCFRRHLLGAAAPDDAVALETIAADPSIHEVILSGGDPLMLPDNTLGSLVERLSAIPHLRRLRVHTRMPVVVPQRVTDRLIAAMRGTGGPHPRPLSQRERGEGLTVLMVVHVNHPAEIDADVAHALGRLIDAGMPVLSQSVLLRGVNDCADVLAELYERLIDLRVIPYYLHQLDPVAGAAHFAVPVGKAVGLISELRARLPGYAVPRYVRETPGGSSKELLA
ncbi:MAG: EF-P beta-lysylation protein EpmB [Thermoguttaceae bacterium]